jgi:hypothetical protein
MQNYSPFFNQGNAGANYTVNGIKPKTTTINYANPKEIYATADLAAKRAYNIGCDGYRSVIVNSNGDHQFSPCSNVADYKRIMTEISPITVERRYYDFDPDQNLYDFRDGINDDTYEGFNYRNQLMERSLSNVIFRDPIKSAIISQFERVVYGLVETTKEIKNFFNYTVKPNNKRVF